MISGAIHVLSLHIHFRPCRPLVQLPHSIALTQMVSLTSRKGISALAYLACALFHVYLHTPARVVARDARMGPLFFPSL